MITLRPYQDSLISESRELIKKGCHSLIITSPCGSGKTVLTARMLKTASDKGMASLFIVHRRELVKQSSDTFRSMGLPHGIIATGFYENQKPLVQIASIQTIVKRIKFLRIPTLIVWDEAHHVAASGWAKVHEAYPDSYHIGLTATPERLDGRGLEKYFKAIVKGPSVRWLIDNGFLCDYKLYAPSSLNLSQVHTSMGDYNKEEVKKIIDTPTITGDAIKHYQRLAAGKRAVVFCVSINHSKNVNNQFLEAGIKSAEINGSTFMEERDQKLRDFTDGNIKVLCNVDLFGEGFNLPSLEAVILLRPTKSLALYIQMSGRALRTYPGKDHAIILDHAGNCAVHGMIDDEREWSLEGRKKGNKAAPASIKICPSCYAAVSAHKPRCTECGFTFGGIVREVVHKKGELEEVNKEAMRRMRMREQAKCQTLDELIAEGKRRGYQRPHGWAQMVWNARKAKELMKV